MESDIGKREFAVDVEFATSGLSGQLKAPKGISAGGINILVVGNQFDSIQKPNMYVYYFDKMFQGDVGA